MIEFDESEKRAYRALAKSDLMWFARWMFINRKGYKWAMAAHHLAICEALEKVASGEIKNLIINIPPRYSKTELVKMFIAKSLGDNPDCEFIYSSYSSRLSSASSFDIREIVQSPEFAAIYPQTQLRNDSKAKDEWRTTAGGVMYSVGSGGTITGYGAGKHRNGFGGAIIIDDPHKADEARSDVMRENVIEWFRNTILSRRNNPSTPIIVIMQRLHEDDLCGWLLNGGCEEKFHHLCLPAITEQGAALWPEKHSLEKLREMERASPYVFAGQYMQRPAPLDGGLFKTSNIEIIDAVPSDVVTWVRGWDLASSVDGDFTAGVKVGKTRSGKFVIADVARAQESVDLRDALIESTTKIDGKQVIVSIPQDPGQAGKTQVLYLTRKLAGYRVRSSPESGDKVTRAEPVAAQVNVGNVMMLRAEWNNDFKNELGIFPNGKYDDQVDALSRAFGELINKGTSFMDMRK